MYMNDDMCVVMFINMIVKSIESHILDACGLCWAIQFSCGHER